MDTGHHRCFRHRIAGIDFITLCQQVLPACPDVEPFRDAELPTQVPQHEILGSIRSPSVGNDRSVKPCDILHARRYRPASLREVRSGIEFVFGSGNHGCVSAQDKASGGSSELPKVYFIKEINSENLVKVYEALGRKAEGKVAVKLSTGEPGGHNFLQPALIAPLVKKVNGTIVECNTAYGGGRANTEAHLKAAADHGFTAIAEVDIMDANGEVSLPVKDGKHLKEDFVGKNYLNYDFTVVLSHFKGHAMGGFGGAIKNISIGISLIRR